MKPELLVRKLVHSMGHRYRLHAKELPGKPDIVFRKRKKVIFVHGCFWHSHELAGCLDARKPKSNTNYWLPKLARNKERDAANVAALQGAGWRVLIVWECDTRDPGRLSKRLRSFLARRVS
jgi:DNA mismatch endonuclease (patch repair protein)